MKHLYLIAFLMGSTNFAFQENSVDRILNLLINQIELRSTEPLELLRFYKEIDSRRIEFMELYKNTCPNSRGKRVPGSYKGSRPGSPLCKREFPYQMKRFEEQLILHHSANCNPLHTLPVAPNPRLSEFVRNLEDKEANLIKNCDELALAWMIYNTKQSFKRSFAWSHSFYCEQIRKILAVEGIKRGSGWKTLPKV